MTSVYLVFFGLVIVEGAIKYCVQLDQITAVASIPLRENFGTLKQSLLSLFMAISGGQDWNAIFEALSLLTWRYQLCFLVFVFYSVFAFMNVMIAVLVEAMIDAARNDRCILVQGEMKA